MNTKLISYFFTALFFTTIPLYSCAMNTPGTLDPSFGGGLLGPLPGTVITNISTGSDIANALIRQPDHKLVAAGQSEVAGNPVFTLARYLPNGELDPNFGDAGIAKTTSTNFI